ncbi:MAG: carboxypeptidase regulatory-like domain-containing protein [Cyanobacteria bacterium REEB67]|nr:carboxypeptidase regulatory-like domain-containing protein [Cyanobacteria bacterium REEB67]
MSAWFWGRRGRFLATFDASGQVVTEESSEFGRLFSHQANKTEKTGCQALENPSNSASKAKSPRAIRGALALYLISAVAIALPATAQTSATTSNPLNVPLNVPLIHPQTPVAPPVLQLPPSPTAIHPDTPGTLIGHIGDADGKRNIEHAQVVLVKVDKDHLHAEQDSDANGDFKFANLEPGEWQVTVSAKDMLSHTSLVKIAAGENKSVQVGLEDLEPVDILRVTGKRTLIHPEKIGSETNLDHRTIQEYKSGNDLKDLIQSTPGVMNDSYGNIISRGEHNAVNYVVDGVVIPEAAGVLQQSQPISPRSLQSMQVDIGGYEAQDGGGPLGAVAHMKSLPILNKPNFTIGQQIGGPLAGSIYYNGSGAFSQDATKWLSRLRFESSGSFRGSTLRIAPPVKNYVGNNGADINVLARLEYQATERDVLRLTVAINESMLRVPTAPISQQFGVRQYQSDRQDYFTLSWRHKYARFFDEGNLHLLNGFYGESYHSSNAFDPAPNINADQPIVSIAAQAKRFNYIFSAQGDINKKIGKTHNFKAGFLSEVRPVKTSFNALYFNSDMGSTQPYGAVVSPFTLTTQGPQFQGPIGGYKGFRYLQSAFLQDRWTPQRGAWKRLTVDAGVRFDLQHSVDGNALALATALASSPGVQPFAVRPFQTQRITDAQASGRYGASYVLTKNSVLRASYSQIFTPTPNDYFLTPILVTGAVVNGVYEGTPKPLHATRGQLFDASIEQQFGPRFVHRTNIFYKKLRNFGDSGVIGNLPIYNRLTNSGQEAYGVETRLDYKGGRNGYGLNGFLSNTVQVAYLRGTHGVTGGFYDFPTPPLPKYPDHDRRYQGTIGLGYRGRSNWWILNSMQVLTGLQNGLDPAIFGQHPGRLPVQTLLSISGGWQVPEKLHQKYALLPTAFDLRIENALNQRVPINLGSPFQGSRYSLPVRVLAGCNWVLGRDTSKLVSKPALPSTASVINGPGGIASSQTGKYNPQSSQI